VSPYNDPLVMAGQVGAGVCLWEPDCICSPARRQGTVACELERQTDLSRVDCVLVTVGGGGLIGGIGSWLKARHPHIVVIGVQPRANTCMSESVRAGRLLAEGEYCNEATLSDGSAGGIEQGAITFDVVRRVVDRWLLVDEPQIAEAMQLLQQHHGKAVRACAPLLHGCRASCVLAIVRGVCVQVEGAAACTVAAIKEHAASLFAGRSVVSGRCTQRH
jgi:threonine dehydratase